jgi:hypothetical protein
MPRNRPTSYGQANPSPIGPTGRIRTSTPTRAVARAEPARVEVIQQGNGPYVTDTSYDESLGKIVVTRGDITFDAVDGPRYGTAVHDISWLDPADDLPEVTDWFPLDGDEIDPDESPLLPDDFEHTDTLSPSEPPLSKLPAGLGFVRLLPGSAALGEARWDADKDEFGREEPLPEDYRLQVVRAFVSDRGEDPQGSGNAEIIVAFNYNVYRKNYYTRRALRSFKFTSSKDPNIKVIEIEDGDRDCEIKLTLSRSITRDERLRIRIGANLFKDATGESGTNLASEWIPLVELLPRSCYVLVINRVRDGDAVATGDRVLIGKPILYFDGNNVPLPVYDLLPMGGAGGVNIVVGSIVGGNAESIQNGQPVAVPGQKPHAFPVPLTDADNQLLLLPTVEDFTALDLPDDYAFGDELPLLPDGLSYVRLERPYNALGAAWDANLALGLASDNTPNSAPTVVGARTVKSNLARVNLMWSREGELPQTASIADYSLALTPKDGFVLEDLAAITIVSLGQDKDLRASTLTLSRPIVPEQETLTVTAVGGAWLSADAPPLPSLSGEADVVPNGDKFTLVLAVNRVGRQYFVQGDMVLLGNTVTVTDDQDVSRTCLEIIGPVGNAVAFHDHLNSGGGPAFLSPRAQSP